MAELVALVVAVALTVALGDAVTLALALGEAVRLAVRCGLCLPFSQPLCLPGGVGLVFTFSRAREIPRGSLLETLALGPGVCFGGAVGDTIVGFCCCI